MSLKARMTRGAHLAGTFVKTPHHAIVEALAGTGLDFVILDAEHCPFGLAEIDRCVLAARAAGLPCLVRITEGSPADILRVLDMGADGIFVPHVTSADGARAVVRASHYGHGGRGYAATNRAGNYGRLPMVEHLRNAKDVIVVVQIEDPEGVDAADDIAAVDGVEACFVGVADLAVSYGVFDLEHEAVRAALDRVVSACSKRSVAVASFAPNMARVKPLVDRGVTVVAIASEHKAMHDFFSQSAIDSAFAR